MATVAGLTVILAGSILIDAKTRTENAIIANEISMFLVKRFNPAQVIARVLLRNKAREIGISSSCFNYSFSVYKLPEYKEYSLYLHAKTAFLFFSNANTSRLQSKIGRNG